MKRRTLAVSALALVTALGCDQFLLQLPVDPGLTEYFRKWNQIAIDASGLDHTPLSAGEDRVFGHQLGPTGASRAMAITHIAMFDAVTAISRTHKSYTGIDPVPPWVSIRAAVAQAAHDTLVALYPSHDETFADALAEDLDSIVDGPAKEQGIALGARAAAAILEMRENDGSEIVENYVISDQPGKWRQDPINPGQQPLGEEWFHVKPFVMNSVTQFRAPEPPALDSEEYAEAFKAVKRLGGDGITTPTDRTDEQTFIGIYWAYDGTPSLCAPPRLYNQIASTIADDQGVTGVEFARLHTLVNVAMADACIAIWDSKFHYNYWRPVTGIREADVGTGPTMLGDGNDETVGDVAWVPLCAPASNLTAPNFTPPFPAYPSGHAGFGGALFQTLRNFFGRDDIEFTFVSQEFDGVTTDNEGNVRPLMPRTFTSLSQAEEENGQSRIYLGIHWRFDKVEGIAQGRNVANWVETHAFERLD